MAEEAAKQEAPKKGPVYYVENVVRRQSSRTHRARSATRHRFKQWVAGRRLLRGKKMPLTEAQFEAEKEKIERLVLAGCLALYLPDGMRITSLPDGRLVYTRADGAVKIGEAPEKPVKDPADTAETPDPESGEEGEADEGELEEEGEAEGDEPTEEPDDLTELPGIGGGRAKKLAEAGIYSYGAIVAMGSEALSGLLGVTDEAAEEICEAAAELGE
jgi:predicted flap endonuclease-1-like 5' DNA nuclease